MGLSRKVRIPKSWEIYFSRRKANTLDLCDMLFLIGVSQKFMTFEHIVFFLNSDVKINAMSVMEAFASGC
jgi:hypothetical protein